MDEADIILSIVETPESKITTFKNGNGERNAGNKQTGNMFYVLISMKKKYKQGCEYRVLR